MTHAVQGYLVGHPMDADAMRARLAEEAGSVGGSWVEEAGS